jgi:hypothetical protein
MIAADILVIVKIINNIGKFIILQLLIIFPI